MRRSGKAQRETNSLKFSELDDLFLNEKGKKLRNLKKKMSNYNELLLEVKKGEIVASPQ